MHARTRRAVRTLVGGMADPTSEDEHRVPLPRLGGRWRLLAGMVLANRPWLLVPGLKSALVAALATGAVATINSTVWLLAGSLSWWRLMVATIASVALVVAWLVIDGELWDRPDDNSSEARERSRLYNVSTLVTLTAGVLICYLALYVVNLVWALFVLDPSVMGGYLQASLGYGDLFVLAWFVASAATVGGGLGSGLESDEAIRAAAYSKREEERRNRLRAATDLGTRWLSSSTRPADPEHPGVAVTTESRWTLNAFPSGLVVFEKSRAMPAPVTGQALVGMRHGGVGTRLGSSVRVLDHRGMLGPHPRHVVRIVRPQACGRCRIGGLVGADDDHASREVEAHRSHLALGGDADLADEPHDFGLELSLLHVEAHYVGLA